MRTVHLTRDFFSHILMCRTRVAWHHGLTAQVCVVRVMEFITPVLHFMPDLSAPLSDNTATIHDQEGTACPPGRTTSHNVRPVTPSLRWIMLRHRVPLSPLPENWWCTELTLTVRRADGCYVPVDDDEDATFFFPAHWHRDGGSVRRGGDPTRSREHHEPIFHAFCIRSTLQVSRWRNDHRCSQTERPCPVVSATVSDGDGSLSRGMRIKSGFCIHRVVD